MKRARLLALLLAVGTLYGADYFVAPRGTDSGRGTRSSPWSLARANGALQPGDTALLLDGTYTGTPIAPERSGLERRPITYRAANRHKALFTDMTQLRESRGPCAVYLTNRSYVTVQGIKVENVKRFLLETGNTGLASS